MKQIISKNMVAVVSTVCLISAVVTGCSGEATEKKGTEQAAQAAETKKEAPPAAANDGKALDPLSEEADNKIIDAEIAKVETPEYFKNTPTFEYLINLGPTPFKEGSFGQKYFEKKFNAKLKYVALDGGNRNEQINLMYATGKNPDVITVTLADAAKYYRQGVLAEVPLDLVKKNMPKFTEVIEKHDPSILKITNVNGKNIALSRFSANSGIPRPAAIRADWLKNVGITKVPETIQELEAAFLKFRNEDPDKNGKKDTYALSNPSDLDGMYWFQSIFGAFGANPFLWVENQGKLQYGFTTPEVKDALKLLNKWYKMELIDPEFITEKGRSSDVEDMATKFAKGKFGYIDHLAFDDHQWDNDGHINFRWVANAPEWQKFFEQNKDDPKKAYATKAFTNFDDTVPQPIYITMPPVKGPQGKSGYFRLGYSTDVMAFGKHLEKDPKKLEKLLKILEYMHADKETYLKLSFGPEGLQWITDKSGEKLLNPEWPKHKLFHPQYKYLGNFWVTNPMYFSNPDYLNIVGGPRSEQRYKLTADVVRPFASYDEKLLVALPSQAKYSEITNTRIKEYVIKAVTGDIDIDKTFDDTVKKWYKDGGEQLTKEANEWYVSFK